LYCPWRYFENSFSFHFLKILEIDESEEEERELLKNNANSHRALNSVSGAVLNAL
jgi:hypothetical protein